MLSHPHKSKSCIPTLSDIHLILKMRALNSWQVGVSSPHKTTEEISLVFNFVGFDHQVTVTLYSTSYLKHSSLAFKLMATSSLSHADKNIHQGALSHEHISLGEVVFCS